MPRSIVAAVSLLALLCAAAVPALAEEAGGHAMITPDQLEWQTVASLPPEVKLAVLEGDLAAAGPFTMRLEFPANFVVPLHTHPVTERVTVLSGTFHLGIGETFDREKAHALPPGGMAVMDPGVPMFAFTGDEPTVIQVHGDGPWGVTYLNPEDDPRKKTE